MNWELPCWACTTAAPSVTVIFQLEYLSTDSDSVRAFLEETADRYLEPVPSDQVSDTLPSPRVRTVAWPGSEILPFSTVTLACSRCAVPEETWAPRA